MRNIADVIAQISVYVDNKDVQVQLNRIREDAFFTAPELASHLWNRLAFALNLWLTSSERVTEQHVRAFRLFSGGEYTAATLDAEVIALQQQVDAMG